MIKSIHFDHYRKLKNLDINFTKNVNVISGTNGTCKTSILHIISNSFQAVKVSTIQDKELAKCIMTVRSICKQYNPKLETLTRGDKNFHDPADGIKGNYYTVEYLGNNSSLSFRKHNSTKEANQFRFAVKPEYKPKSGDSLPCLPVIYLGLGRLVTYGEFSDSEPITEIKEHLPQKYLNELADLYRKFTHYSITDISNQHMGKVKIRADFSSSESGVDSNTISAGEDNLYIILSALISLKYYFESLQQHQEIDSILLIDEFDATLHPAFQRELFDLALSFSEKYNIQIVFTSHSLFLLEHCSKRKQNLIYLYDNESDVYLFDNPSIFKIQMYLKSQCKDEIFVERHIPVYTEDAEARYLIQILFKYYAEKYEEFHEANRMFYFVNANLGSENLRNIFNDANLKNFAGQFCILDGDKTKDLNNRIITLPGGNSPEQFLIEYSALLYERDGKFWVSDLVLDENLGKNFYLNHFLPDAKGIENKINSLKQEGKSTHGITRDENKKLFNKYKKFFHLLFDAWLSDDCNKDQIDSFYKDLNIMFKQVAPLNGIDPNLWNINS